MTTGLKLLGLSIMLIGFIGLIIWFSLGEPYYAGEEEETHL